MSASEERFHYMGWPFPVKQANDVKQLVFSYQDRVTVEWPETGE